MAEVQVKQLSHNKDGWVFEVEVLEGVSRTVHEVTLSEADFEKLGKGKVSAAQLVKASFEFLLEREEKESILTQFELPIIAKYFPEYRRKIGSYFPGKSAERKTPAQ